MVRLAVDAVIFGYTPAAALNVLLIRRGVEPFAGYWALPGGFIREGESLETAVRRELRDEAGVEPDYLEQLYTFGNPQRDPRGHIVSVAYYGLVRPSKFQPVAGSDAEAVGWWPLQQLPDLAFDHASILLTALDRLRTKAAYEPIGFELLDEKFPFSDLEHLYSTLLGAPVERRNFRKKMLQFGFVEALPEKVRGDGGGRPGALFAFNRDRYFQLKAEGIVFEFAQKSSLLT